MFFSYHQVCVTRLCALSCTYPYRVLGFK